MRRQQTVWAVLGFIMLTVLPSYGVREEQSLTVVVTADDSGSTFTTITSIEGVRAIASVLPGGTGAAGAVVDQALIGNRVEEHNVNHSSLIQDSFQHNVGILNVNQESGNFNNQANVRVLALVAAESLLQDLEVSRSARSTDNTLISSGGRHENRIANSFGGTVGIVGVNQSSGSLNQQLNALVLGIGLVLSPEVVVLGDASLGEVNANNTLVQDPDAPRADIISDSFNGFRGIAQVSQSSGDLNTISNVLGLSVNVMEVR